VCASAGGYAFIVLTTLTKYVREHFASLSSGHEQTLADVVSGHIKVDTAECRVNPAVNFLYKHPSQNIVQQFSISSDAFERKLNSGC